MRVIEKEVSDEKCGTIGKTKRRLIEGSPADEDPAGSTLDEGEVVMHR